LRQQRDLGGFQHTVEEAHVVNLPVEGIRPVAAPPDVERGGIASKSTR
jgi:hypothetical protein